MAFNFNLNNEFSSNWNNNYPDSDSDDQFKPRQIMDLTDLIQPSALRENTQRSFTFDDANERQPGPTDFVEEEGQITYTKYNDEDGNKDLELELEYDPNEKNQHYFWNNGGHFYQDQFGIEFEMADDIGYEKAQLRESDDMEVEESDYQSTAFTCDNEDNFTMNESQIDFENSEPISKPDTGSTNIENNIDSSFFTTALRNNAVRMREIVDKMLQGRGINESEISDLNDFEKSVLLFINQRKSKSEGVKNAKRREEKQKLFFKSALKFIENRFMTELSRANNGMKKKDMNSEIFYATYFDKVAREKGLDIAAFYPPNQRRGGGRSDIKSFNLRYIELLLSSKRFIEETLQFLEEEFVQNYSKSRYKKIDKIIEHATDVFDQTLRQFMKNRDQTQENFMDLLQRRLQDLLINNPKSKLPWSNAELNEAKEFALQTIQKIYQKTSHLY